MRLYYTILYLYYTILYFMFGKGRVSGLGLREVEGSWSVLGKYSSGQNDHQ